MNNKYDVKVRLNNETGTSFTFKRALVHSEDNLLVVEADNGELFYFNRDHVLWWSLVESAE